MDLQKKQFKTEVAGKQLTLETSRLAGQANSAVLGTYGGTTVLATAVMTKKDKNMDYFPLMVNYEEKFYSVGKILGGRFMKREARPSEEAVLTGRIIDRTIRPLFNHAMRRDVQVVITVLGYDGENDPDFIGLIAASTALGISSIPWNGPVAGIRMVKIKGEQNLLVNPDKNSLVTTEVEFDAFAAGTKERINMIEFEGDEAQEKDALAAFASAQKEITNLVTFQEEIIKEIGKEKEAVPLAEPSEEIKKLVSDFVSDKLEKAVFNPDKKEMQNAMEELKSSMKAMLIEKAVPEEEIAKSDAVFEEKVDALLHKKVLEEEERPDGRKLDEVRELHAEAGFLPRAHGSALFVRGDTQSLSIATLGAPGDQQLMETIEFSGKKRFLLHYNFPPYSVGETGPFRGPGRREIGHGALAEKALKALIPSQDEFPYTIRLVSEILSSNGSSSMATVCAGSLALMDAGVPIKNTAAGIAMGLILDQQPTTNNQQQKFKVLTDIQGPEDHYGDMDFKVAGTDKGLTAIQLDVKINGITIEMIEKTLAQAKDARLHILKTIKGALPEPRKELSSFAPRILSMQINPEQIGGVIGPGGKVINGIIKETGVTSIDIEEDGRVFITSEKADAAQKAIDYIASFTKEYQAGDIVEGTVVKILEFGAIVEFGGGRDGMIHVSELKDGFVKKVEDVVKVGDSVKAKIVKMDNGKIGLSLKRMEK